VKIKEGNVNSNEYEYCGITAFEGCQEICELALAVLVLRGINPAGANPILAQIISDKRDLAIEFVLEWLVGEKVKEGIDVQGKEFCQIIDCSSQGSCEQRRGIRFRVRKAPNSAKGSCSIFGPTLPRRSFSINGNNLPT
jgi:hypothetical protein